MSTNRDLTGERKADRWVLGQAGRYAFGMCNVGAAIGMAATLVAPGVDRSGWLGIIGGCLVGGVVLAQSAYVRLRRHLEPSR